MKLPQSFVRTLGILLFSIGLLLGMALFGAVVWADFEAALFDPSIQQDARLRSLRCPVMITEPETGTVTATLSNPLNRPTERYVRAHITDGFVTLMREVNRTVSLAPGETQRLEWTVTAEDAAFERFILVKVVLRGRYPLPSRQGTCGILVVDVPFLTGNQVFGLTFGAGLLSMLAGFGIWLRARWPLRYQARQAARAMVALTGGIIVGTIVALLGWWLPAAIIFLITLIGIGVIIGHFLNQVGGESV